MIMTGSTVHCLCGCDSFQNVFTYRAPPAGEVRFSFNSIGEYHRLVLRCTVCGHFISVHDMDMDMERLYQRDYVSSTYGGEEGIRQAFDRINSLDPSMSDNVGRVMRIIEFATSHRERSAAKNRPPSVLDVGSGLCVFLHRMKAAGWLCMALDGDQRLVDHARKVVGVDAVCADFGEITKPGGFDAITFNKVLEHVEDPIAMLRKSIASLNGGGFVYFEVPDGEGAVVEGPEREEFFIEHHHVFSMASTALLASRAGFVPVLIERIREPSGKFTLRAFLVSQ